MGKPIKKMNKHIKVPATIKIEEIIRKANLLTCKKYYVKKKNQLPIYFI